MKEKNNIDFSGTLADLYDRKLIKLNRIPQRYSFGDYATCENIFYQAFAEIDKSADKIQRLPEYKEIIEWLTDTQNKGLLLIGGCGIGKTTIACGVIPLLFAHFKKISITPVPAEDLHRQIDKLIPEAGYFNQHSIYVIDDVGCEPPANDYGNKYEPVTRLINEAEAKIKPLIITTNLLPEQLLKRYGTRTMDRIYRLCKVIKFNGKSLRK